MGAVLVADHHHVNDSGLSAANATAAASIAGPTAGANR